MTILIFYLVYTADALDEIGTLYFTRKLIEHTQAMDQHIQIIWWNRSFI